MTSNRENTATQATGFMIRPFENDYGSMVELWNLHNPDWTRTIAEEQDSDAKLEAKYQRQRFVAEVQGQVVGIGEYHHNPGQFHPHHFSLESYLHPDFYGQGIGKALYNRLLEALEPHQPELLMAQVRESSLRGLRFVHDRGFAELKRDFVSTLDVRGTDLTEFTGLIEELSNQGIHLKSFAELLADDPQAPHKLHELWSDVRLDVPRAAAPTPISFEFFSENILGSTDFDAQFFLVALDSERWVGMSCMYRVGDSGKLDLWMTGVRRAYRGCKIAQALKVRGVELAKTLGFESIRTDNDSRNAAMIAINDKLGFERGPSSITLQKRLAKS